MTDRLLHWLLRVFAATVSCANAAEVEVIDTPAPVIEIVKTDAGAFAQTQVGAFKITACDEAAICLQPAEISGLLDKAPEGGLPDGRTAVASSGDIRRAWYGRPTERYGHAVLGDAIEAGSLIAESSKGERFEFILDTSFVFEDITPRIFDLDGDGKNEIITIRSSLGRGAAIAIYGLTGGVLAELASTPEIGRSNRWLNIAGIADYPGAGVAAIAWVETPHIGGILRMGVYANRKFEIFSNSYNGFSNHFIGSRELGLSATGDFTADGVPDLAIPSADRNSMVIAARSGIEHIALPGRVGHAVVAVDGRIVTADTDGRLIVIQP